MVRRRRWARACPDCKKELKGSIESFAKVVTRHMRNCPLRHERFAKAAKAAEAETVTLAHDCAVEGCPQPEEATHG